MNVLLDGKFTSTIISLWQMSQSKFGLDPFPICVSTRIMLSPFNKDRCMNEFPFVMSSQFQLKTSHSLQNGLVWVRPALLGRFGDSSELCSSQVWWSELCSTSGWVMMMCQCATDRWENALGPMAHLQSWSDIASTIFCLCAFHSHFQTTSSQGGKMNCTLRNGVKTKHHHNDSLDEENFERMPRMQGTMVHTRQSS